MVVCSIGIGGIGQAIQIEFYSFSGGKSASKVTHKHDATVFGVTSHKSSGALLSDLSQLRNSSLEIVEKLIRAALVVPCKIVEFSSRIVDRTVLCVVERFF